MKKALRWAAHFTAFRDKYLAAVMMVAALFISSVVSAQVDTTKVRQRINAYGYEWRNGTMDSSFRIPRDTFRLRQSDTGSIAFKSGKIWKWVQQGGVLRWMDITEGSAVNEIDIFLIAGQSNAKGAGDSALSLDPVIGTVFQYNSATGLTYGQDIIGSGSSAAQTGSAWPAFGVTYYNITGRKICFVNAAVNATTNTAAAPNTNGTWDTTGVLFDTSVSRVQQALSVLTTLGYTPVFKGVLWGQGENDAIGINSAAITQADYIAAFQKLIRRYRGVFGSRMPFYIFRTGTITNQSDAGFAQIREAQVQVANGDSLTNVVFYNAIDFPGRGLMNVDETHYLQAGYNEMGRIGAQNVLTANGYGWQTQAGNIFFPLNNVGIGVDTPQRKLDVLGSAIISDTIFGGKTASESLHLYSNTTATPGRIFIGPNASFTQSSGALGIGTSSPSDFIHIEGNTNAAISHRIRNLSNGNSAGARGLYFNDASVGGQVLMTSSAATIGANTFIVGAEGSGGMTMYATLGDLRFQYNASSSLNQYAKFRRATGNFIINNNTDDFGQKLQVTGSGRFSDSLLLANVLTGSGTDSVLVINNGLIKKVLQSSIGGGGGVTDHGALTGLADDDHTQYALLAGRSTGQTLQGGTGAGETLTLESTSHATKGSLITIGNIEPGTGSTYTLGLSGTPFDNLFVNAANINGQITVNTFRGLYIPSGLAVPGSTIGIGSNSLNAHTTGVRNIGIGENALATITTGFNNTAIGNGSLDVLSVNNNSNTALGYNAGGGLTNGNTNLFVGSSAGVTQSGGSNNIALGPSTGLTSTTGSNQLSIGNIIYGLGVDGSGSTVSTGFIGIKNKSPLNALHVSGKVQIDTIADAGTVDSILVVNAGVVEKATIAQLSSVITNLYNANGTLAGDRVVTQGGNELLITNTSGGEFIVSGESKISLVSTASYVRINAGLHLTDDIQGNSDLTLTDAMVQITLDTITANRTITMPTVPQLSSEQSGQYYFINDNYENGFFWLLSGVTVKDMNGTTLTQLENKTTYIIRGEFNGTENYYRVISAYNNKRASATLDFPSTSAGTSSDLTISLPGAALGDIIGIGVPNGSTLSNGCFTAWVSASGTVTVRFTNNDTLSALDPASGTFNVKKL